MKQLTVIVLYAFGYALVVTLLTFKFQEVPLLLQFENSIYDPWQKFLAIDHYNDWRYDRFEKSFAEIHGINLDSSMIDLECDRLKRDRLTDLLNLLSKTDQVKSVFLDYQFEPLEVSADGKLIGNDDALYNSMLDLGSKLVLVDANSNNSKFNKSKQFEIKKNFQNAIKKLNTGSIQLGQLNRDSTIRYIDVAPKSDSLSTYLKIMTDLWNAGEYQQNLLKAPESIELNYIFRGLWAKGKLPAIVRQDALEILDNNNISSLANTSGGKLVFVGAFEEKFNKYNIAYDSFQTPIDNSLSGIYINLNAYLNIANNAYLRRCPLKWVFITNIFLAIIGALYYQQVKIKVESVGVKPILWLRFELILIPILFGGLLFLLFFFNYLKYSFVITMIPLMVNQYFYDKLVNPFLSNFI